MTDHPTSRQRIEVTFERTDSIVFVIDDDEDLCWIGESLPLPADRIFAFIDENVAQLWQERISAQLERAGQTVFWYAVPPREESKSLRYYPRAVRFLEEHRCGRHDMLLAIGGGITVDLASFLASTYMRGIHLVVIATTLIAQMDATTAGKTCLNTEQGKNTLGTFYYPSTVYSNTAFLDTNSPRHLRQGYSEIFKYGLLASPELVAKLGQHRRAPSAPLLQDILRMTIETRAEICRRRGSLASNLGHTFGHALEKLSGYEILHGDAINAGTVMALHFAEAEGIIERSVVQSIVRSMKDLGLNVYFDKGLQAEEMVRLMMRDKKSSYDSIHLVLIRDVGQPYDEQPDFFYPVSPDHLVEFLEVFFANKELGIDRCAEFLRRDELFPRGNRA